MLSPEHQIAQMSKIQTTGLTRSGIHCRMLYSCTIWQHWASKG